jgi:hypothetical protein
MNNRKPIVLKNVELNDRRTIGLPYGREWRWTPLIDLNFVELWQKSESVEHFVESYKFNHPQGKGYETGGVYGARQRYTNLRVPLKRLRHDHQIQDEMRELVELSEMRLLAAKLEKDCR